MSMPDLTSPDAAQLSQKLRAAMLRIATHRFDNVGAHIMFLLDECRSALGANRASLWIFERGGQRLQLRMQSDDGVIASTGTVMIEQSSCPRYFAALRSDFCVDVTDAKNDARTSELYEDYLKPSGIQSLMDCPVRALGDQVGVLCVEHSAQMRDWHILEQSFTNGVAIQISLALERDELRQANASLVKRVLFDQLTGLPNFLHLDDALKQALGDLSRGGLGVGLVYADIEQFLLICNSLGQSIAQSLLVALANRLRVIAGSEIFVARAGDDDFAFVLRATDPLVDAKAMAFQLLKSMAEPLSAQGRDISCTLSVGYTARGPNDGDLNAESLLREGWTASRAARRSGLPRIYERSLLIRTALEVELEQELRKALREGQFEPHLQPIFSLDSEMIVGFEALMRWRQPGRGIVTPVEFMGVAQRTGLIVQMGQQLLVRTLTDFAALCRAHPRRELTLFFNMSPPEFLRESLVQEITTELARTGLTPKHLALEITENVIIEDMPKTQANMKALQQLGIGVHLDDLGTGYSSLNYLRVLPVNGIKLDYSFIHDIERNHRSAALVKALVGLSESLGQEAIAEGVEWEGQLQQLHALGIILVQGYLFAYPTAIPEITPEWIYEKETQARALFKRLGDRSN
jgi:diguanylate cyclase (GGDEF)-like protein